MSVPLDRLYHFLQSLCDRDDIIIYRYFPHGSKKLIDCWPILGDQAHTPVQQVCAMHMICHDQEPLSDHTASFVHGMPTVTVDGICYQTNPAIATSTFKTHLAINSVYDQVLLVHSERNSPQVQRYGALGCVPVYYWCHAVLAQDWYRYAQHDPDLAFDSGSITHDFLVYNRAWSGTREYRLKFAELIVRNHLTSACRMRFRAEDDGRHYQTHHFVNPAFEVTCDLHNHFEANDSPASASADYVSADYRRCGMEVVLETLFDDTKHHLTEKILKPIACGRAFLLASTPGSLAYLRSYGFETFGDYLDESYDTVQDPVQRLNAIVAVMKHINQLSDQQRGKLWQDLDLVAQRNRARFFSAEFLQQVMREFQQNLDHGIQQMQRHRTGWFSQQWLHNQPAGSFTASELAAVSCLINMGSQSAGGSVC